MRSLPKGTNVRLLFQQCACSDALLTSPDRVIPRIRQAIRDAGLEDLSETHHAFEKGGYTLAVILAESHVVVHTWPELERMVLIEISICDFTRPNQEKALRLGELTATIYQPKSQLREISTMIPRLLKTPFPGHGHYVEVDALLETRRSELQEISLVETPAFGRAIVIDDLIQTSERDDFFYHEPLVHVPMLSHPNPQNVLICGGGDGGAAKEVLKHPTVETCTIVDFDSRVVDLAGKELTAINQGALYDPRVRIVIEDARMFLENNESFFDTIVMDTADPASQSDLSFSPGFFQNVHERLSENGCFCFHFGSPFMMDQISVQTVRTIRSLFESSYLFFHFVPSNGTLVGYALCFKSFRELIPAEQLEERYTARKLKNLRIVTPKTFHALFVMPPWIERTFSNE